MRLIGYIRVSRVAGREGNGFISPEVQKETVLAYAKAHGHEVVEWKIDLDQSGGKIDRPGLQEALAMIERGEAEGLIAAKVDRLARSVQHLGRLMDSATEDDWNLIAVDLGLDHSTPNGRLVWQILGAIAEWYRSCSREQWAEARSHAIETGIPIGPPPFGYRRGERGLEPDPETGPLVKELFRRRGAGAAWRDLCAWLDEVAPREDGSSWPLSSVAALPSSRTYLGEVYSGDFVNPKAHEPLVTRAEWEAAQGAPRLPSTLNKDGALLAGILTCASCGRRMTRVSDGKRGYWRYQCQKRSAAGKCPAPVAVSMTAADEYVERRFLDSLELDAEIVGEGTPGDAGLDEALAELEAAEEELRAYMETDLVSVVGRDVFAAGVQARASKRDEARQNLAELQRGSLTTDRRELRETWPELTVPERRAILAAAIESAVVVKSNGPGKGTPVSARVLLRWRRATDDLDAPAELRAAAA